MISSPRKQIGGAARHEPFRPSARRQVVFSGNTPEVLIKRLQARKYTMSDRAGALHFDQRIVRDPKICGGEPVFKGTRVTLRTVLASLATSDTPETVLADFPSLTPEDIQAAIAFAAASAEEDLPVRAVPQIQ